MRPESPPWGSGFAFIACRRQRKQQKRQRIRRGKVEDTRLALISADRSTHTKSRKLSLSQSLLSLPRARLPQRAQVQDSCDLAERGYGRIRRRRLGHVRGHPEPELGYKRA